MRLLVDIPDEQVEQARALAERTGRRLDDVVQDALLAMLMNAASDTSTRETSKRPVKLHTYPGRSGPAPGIDPTRYASYLAAMDEEYRDSETGEIDIDRLR